MRFDPDKYHRRTIRLPGYDYRSPGAYFVTICVQQRECILGEIIESEMRLNSVGEMVQTIWRELPDRYDAVQLDAFFIMPNHVHGIVILVGAGPRACPVPRAYPDPCARLDLSRIGETGQPQGVAPTFSLSDVVHRFKSLTTTRHMRGVRDKGWPPFPGRLWQRNYHEHIIRNETELAEIRRYTLDNPLHWDDDPENQNTA